MDPTLKQKQREYLAALLIIAVGFMLRIHASSTVPLIFDEHEKLSFISQIQFNKEHLSLPLGSDITNNPPLLPYLMKGSMALFGENTTALRLPSVVLGTLTLLVVFLLIKESLGVQVALLTTTLMSLSQFCIGSSRIAWEDGILLFFASMTLLFVQKGLRTGKKHFLWLAATSIGFGLLTKGTFATLLPVIAFYLFFHGPNKNTFPKKQLLIMSLIILAINAPTVLWNLTHGNPNYVSYSREADLLSPSLVPATLFLGEILVTSAPFLDDHTLRLMTSFEYPFLNWLIGLLIVVASVDILRKRRNKFIDLLIWTFYFHVLLFSLIRPRSGGGFFFHFDNFWWAIIAVIPGFVFVAVMLTDLNKRHTFARVATFLLIVYMTANAVQFVNFPANCFIPRKSIQKEELISAAKNFEKMGDAGRAREIYRYINRHYR